MPKSFRDIREVLRVLKKIHVFEFFFSSKLGNSIKIKSISKAGKKSAEKIPRESLKVPYAGKMFSKNGAPKSTDAMMVNRMIAATDMR